jgi:hypothetical protein
LPLTTPSLLSRATRDFNVWSNKKRIEKWRYMHRNPAGRELVREPQDWRWSSFRHYTFDERGPVLVNEQRRAVLKLSGKALEVTASSKAS